MTLSLLICDGREFPAETVGVSLPADLAALSRNSPAEQYKTRGELYLAQGVGPEPKRWTDVTGRLAGRFAVLRPTT